SFAREFSKGLSEDFGVDLCEHTPYGCSKLSADLYCQDYALLYGLKVGIFRMSCIYGTRQFGVEDQGWVAWFAIAALLGKEITIFGDGKQVRDVLYVEDLIKLYDMFLQSDLRFGVFNTGGGKENVLSLLQLLDILKKEIGAEIRIKYDDWRPSDQKVYISDTTKAKKELGWTANISPEEGVRRLLKWVKSNKSVFEHM
ncbi:MAG: GDP-mannose 4,6-dehydratase, partial [Nitrospirae bacterium]|nr:GDP-mannose 4,6-dehydratase [Nitrospirota bacterium]